MKILNKYSALLFILIFPPLVILESCDSSNHPTSSEFIKATVREERTTTGPILFISTPRWQYGHSERYRLYSMNENGGNIQPFPYDTSINIYHASWSPDGKKIAADTKDGILIMNDDGSGGYLIAEEGFINELYYYPGRAPVWSPSGKTLVYSRLLYPEALGTAVSFIFNIRQRIEHMIHKTDYLGSISGWSNDGTILVGTAEFFTQDSSGAQIPNHQIIFINLQGQLLRSWGEPGYSNFGPLISPSGNTIAFASSKGGDGQQIRIMNFDGTGDHELVKLNGSVPKRTVAWSPGGDRLLIQVGDTWYPDSMLVINVGTKEVKDITPFDRDSTYSYAVSWRH